MIAANRPEVWTCLGKKEAFARDQLLGGPEEALELLDDVPPAGHRVVDVETEEEGHGDRDGPRAVRAWPPHPNVKKCLFDNI